MCDTRTTLNFLVNTTENAPFQLAPLRTALRVRTCREYENMSEEPDGRTRKRCRRGRAGGTRWPSVGRWARRGTAGVAAAGVPEPRSRRVWVSFKGNTRIPNRARRTDPYKLSIWQPINQASNLVEDKEHI